MAQGIHWACNGRRVGACLRGQEGAPTCAGQAGGAEIRADPLTQKELFLEQGFQGSRRFPAWGRRGGRWTPSCKGTPYKLQV